MWNYVARRLLYVIPTILGVSVIMFFLLFVAPGDPLATLLPPDATVEDKARLAKAMGLDKPVYIQYGIWLSNAVQGDLGRSFHNNVPVFDEVTSALKNTFILAAAAAVLSITAGVVLGTIAAFNQGRLIDKIASAIAITGLSLPNYWVAILLIILFSVTWGVLPAQGHADYRRKRLWGLGYYETHGHPSRCADDDFSWDYHPHGTYERPGGP